MRMPLRKTLLLLACPLAAAPAATAASAAAPGRARQPAQSVAPSRAEVSAAVARAERSAKLWATVNVCDTQRSPDVIGIRGQMPALGFPAQLRMSFKIDYWKYSKSRFERLTTVQQPVVIGTETSGTYQSGVRFTFSPHVGLLRGRVTFTWRRDGRTIGQVDRLTRYGHAADYGDPAGFTDWKCVIP